MIDLLLQGVSLIVVIGVLVFIHELGHFLAAKYFGVKVEVFSLGFGRRLLGFQRGETDYRVAAIPLGGYVKMLGQADTPDQEAATLETALDPRSYLAKPRWQRLIILFAGPAMNIALALVLWWGLFMAGTETLDVPEGPPQVEAFEAGSPAEAGGLAPGDRIVAIAGEPIASVEDYEKIVLFRPGQTLSYRIERGSETLTRDVTLATHPMYGVGVDGVRVRIPILVQSVLAGGPADKAGFRAGDRILEVNGRIPGGQGAVASLVEEFQGRPVQVTVLREGGKVVLEVVPQVADGGRARIGVMLTYPRKTVRYGPLRAAGEALKQARDNAGVLFQTLSKLVTGAIGPQVMSGPLEIARIAKEQAEQGVKPFLGLLAFISIQLGIFNLLPIPVLDGGHILTLLVESVMRRDLSVRLKERVLQVGFVFLILFAVGVIGMDLLKAYRRLPAAPPAVETPAKP
ncbi:MAG: RIP metalloprotease RseP [Acidobacteria bacterium]|nr:RIP metalloprotease RseP [Acidobacteriota bacterium]MCU0253286.1 RIP metalloprotease RseP [Acidobacteriota bacterium]